MRYFVGFVCVLVLGVVPLVGCGETIPECRIDKDCSDQSECTEDRCNGGVCENTAVEDGTACEGSTECTVAACASGACESTPIADGTACADGAGACQQGSCQVACTEQGIRDAIAAGGGPYTFGCDGPTTVVTEAEIVIDNDVILDGQGKLTVDGNEEHRVFFVDQGVTAELTGFTVTRGRVRLVDIIENCVGAPEILCHPGNGAGIKNHGALTLTNSNVTECFAPFQEVTTPGARFGGRGGGIQNGLVGTMTLTNSTVSGNTAVWGGGIDNDGSMTITDSVVSENRAAEWYSTQGGGITNYGTLTVTNSVVAGNASEDWAGGIANTGTLTLMNSVVSNNAADQAAGIDNYSVLMVVNSTVSDNLANNGGGGISNATWAVTTVVNSTVSGNVAGWNSGIANYGESVELINVTVSHNIATSSGGVAGLWNGSEYRETKMTVTNTLVNNDCHGDGITVSGGHNIESPGNTCSFDQSTDMPGVSVDDLKPGELADNGGPTMTHALGAGSVAIDVISVEDCVDTEGAPLTTDQRGVARPQGESCDVGAFELEMGP